MGGVETVNSQLLSVCPEYSKLCDEVPASVISVFANQCVKLWRFDNDIDKNEAHWNSFFHLGQIYMANLCQLIIIYKT